MAKRENGFSLAALLYDLGGRICFRPTASFHTASSVEKKKEGKYRSALLPYKKKVKNALSKAAEQSVLLGVLHRLISFFFTQRVRSFSIFFFTLGFFQILSYFASDFISALIKRESNLVFGVALVFLALISSFARGDVSKELKRSLFYRRVLREYFGISEWQLPSGKGRDNPVLMFLLGLVMGVASLIVSPVLLVNAIVLIVFVLFVFHSPEAGLILAGSCAFFLPFQWVSFCVFLTALSFLCKCLVGKRSLVFSPMDVAVFLFFLLLFISSGTSSVFLKNSAPLFLLYFLSSCLVRNVATLNRILRALSSISVVMTLWLVLRQAVETFMPEAFLRVDGLEDLFFVRPTEEVGVLLAMAIPLTMGLMRSTLSGGKRLFRFVLLLIQIFGLAQIRSASVWVVAILGMAVFFLFSYRSSLIVACITGLSLMVALRLFPRSVLLSVLNALGMNGETSSLASVTESGFFEFLKNTYGGFMPILFFALFIFFFVECVLFCTKTVNERVHPAVLGVMCSVLVFLAISFRNLMPDESALALLMLLLALPKAAHRAALREAVLLPY